VIVNILPQDDNAVTMTLLNGGGFASRIVGQNKLVFTDNGTAKVRLEDSKGNITPVYITVNCIDKEAPVGTVRYIIQTDKTVWAYLENITDNVSSSGDCKVLNVDDVKYDAALNEYYFIFTDNRSKVFQIMDGAGNIGNVAVVVGSIDLTKPEAASVKWDPANVGDDSKPMTGIYTNSNVKAFFTLSERVKSADVKVVDPQGVDDAETGDYVVYSLNGTGLTMEFKKNAQISLTLTDFAGNASDIILVPVDGRLTIIDKEAPVIQVGNDYTGTAKVGSVKYTFTSNEDVCITSERNADSLGNSVYFRSFDKAFTQNGTYTLTFADRAGNVAAETITVAQIDTEGPKLKIGFIKQDDFTGSSMSIDKSNGALIKMDGKIITTGSKTTIREGTSKIELDNGTKYIIPQYDEEDGEVVSDSPDFGESYLDIRWDSGIDFFQTIGGFAMNLKYGVFGEMVSRIGKTDDYNKEGNVISFGGSLDLSFMTPGGAQTARENKSKNSSWEIMNVPKNAFDTSDRQEMEVEPTTENIAMPAATVYINDVLFGQHKEHGTDTPDTGFIGINAKASATLPKIVECFPSSMSRSIAINTIGCYQVGVDGSVETTNLELNFSLVVKEDPSGNGAPIPDKLYFMIGGFEPGFNVDSMGVFWITGGGGGFDHLYDTIFGTDGVPPFTLLMTVQFDIFKIMTGTGDLELSLRSLGVTLSDVSLKMIKNAKFLDGGSVKIAWYPNFAVNIGAKVNFNQIFIGSFSLSASVDDRFFEMFLGVGVTLPEAIPIIGGLNVAYAEIGGGTEKLWGMLELLGIQLGVTYYWSSGDVKFGTRSSMKLHNTGTYLASAGDILIRPVAVGYDSDTGQTKFMELGGNLEVLAGSGLNATLTEEAVQSFEASKKQMLAVQFPYVNSTKDLTSHLFNLGSTRGSNVLYINSRNNELPDNVKDIIKVYDSNHNLYKINYFDKTKTDLENKNANANIVVSDGTDGNPKSAGVYITIPEGSYMAGDWLADLGSLTADFTIVGVNPIANLKALDAACNGSNLSLSWDGAALDGATISVYLTQDKAKPGIGIANEIKATDKNADIALPDTLSSGDYYVRVVLSKEGECFTQYFVKYSNKTSDYKQISFINNNAPGKPASTDLSNYGNDKLKVDIAGPGDSTNLDGYLVDVYEQNDAGEFDLKQTGLYYSKNQTDKILIGGIYDEPVYENGQPKLNQDGTPVTEKVGFVPGRQYKVAVMLANYEKYKGYVLSAVNPETAFTDRQNIAGWAAADVASAQKAGIIGGKPGNIFDPGANATRAEVSAIFRRFVEALLK